MRKSTIRALAFLIGSFSTLVIYLPYGISTLHNKTLSQINIILAFPIGMCIGKYFGKLFFNRYD